MKRKAILRIARKFDPKAHYLLAIGFDKELIINAKKFKIYIRPQLIGAVKNIALEPIFLNNTYKTNLPVNLFTTVIEKTELAVIDNGRTWIAPQIDNSRPEATLEEAIKRCIEMDKYANEIYTNEHKKALEQFNNAIENYSKSN
jgi:hypothetical protein